MDKNKPAKLPSKLYTAEASASAKRSQAELDTPDPENASEVIGSAFKREGDENEEDKSE